MSQKETHYEAYLNRMRPYQAKAQKAFDILANDATPLKVGDKTTFIKDNCGAWMKMLHAGDFSISDGKKIIELVNRGMKRRQAANALDAFIFLLYKRLYDQSKNEDGSLSILRALHTNINFAIHQETLGEMGPPGPNGNPANNSFAQTCAEVNYHSYSHELNGKRVYEVSSGLAVKLNHTELRGLTSDDVRLPFDNIYIVIPPEAGFKIYNDSDRQWHDVEGAYVTEDRCSIEEPAGRYRINYKNGNMQCTDGIRYEDREKVRSWSMMFIGGPGKDANGKPIPHDDALFFFRLYFPENTTIEDCVAQTHKRNESYGNSDLIKTMQDVWTPIFNWCLNVILYATCAQPDEDLFGDKEAQKLWQRIEASPAGSKTKINLQKKLDAMNAGKRLVLGRSITVDRTRPGSAENTLVTGRTVSVRTKVAGHWRRVPHGKGKSQRRLKFIEPFWRGPNIAEQVARRHMLK